MGEANFNFIEKEVFLKLIAGSGVPRFLHYMNII